MPLPVKHLSASQVRTAKMCLRMLQYREVERRPDRPDALRCKGTSAHRVSAADLTHRRDHGTLMSDSDLIDLAATTFEEEAFTVDWKAEEGIDHDTAKDETIGMSRAHHTTIAPAIRPVKIEYRMERQFAGLPLTLVGFCDVLDDPGPERPLVLRDTKTKAKAPIGVEKKKVPRDENAVTQLVTYRLLIAPEVNGRPVRTVLDYLWPTKGGQAYTDEIEIARNDVRLALEDYVALVKLYEAGVYPRTGRGSWVCTAARCAFYAECILGRSRALDL
jgi:hypothetical protein